MGERGRDEEVAAWGPTQRSATEPGDRRRRLVVGVMGVVGVVSVVGVGQGRG